MARNGLKIAEDTSDGPAGGMTYGSEGLKFTRMKLSVFASSLGSRADGPVIDKTGLRGLYTFNFEPPPRQGTTAETATGAVPSIFTALQEQLGLRLEPQKVPVETIVIDSAEKPAQDESSVSFGPSAAFFSKPASAGGATPEVSRIASTMPILPRTITSAQQSGMPIRDAMEPALSFEVVSIKPHPLPPGQVHMRISSPTTPLKAVGNRFEARTVTVGELIMSAYAVFDYQISDLPNWAHLGGDTFDVIAQSRSDAIPNSDQLRVMLQNLLTERFGLKIHRQNQELPVYQLVTDKKGLKMKLANGNTATNVSKGRVDTLIPLLSLFLDRPVLDKTGLDGIYEITFDTRGLRDELALGKPTPSIFPELQQQLGLRLEPAKDVMQFIAIDRLTKPTPN